MSESYLSAKQVATLLAPIKEHRVGKDGKGFSHVEAYELRAHLNRIFGFARWSEEVLEQALVVEESAPCKNKKGQEYTGWTVCYRSLVRLTVCAPDGTVLAVYTEGATGDASNQPSRTDAHDLALKTSASQAFKRCCMNLGDSFGLSLYRKGSTAALVKVTLVGGEGTDEDLQDAAPPTFREPHPEPARTVADLANPDPHPAVPPTPPGPPPAPAGPPTHDPIHPGAKTPAEFADAINAAATKGDVRRLLRDAGMAGLADEEVGDAQGEPVSINTLCVRRMKELPS